MPQMRPKIKQLTSVCSIEKACAHVQLSLLPTTQTQDITQQYFNVHSHLFCMGTTDNYICVTSVHFRVVHKYRQIGFISVCYWYVCKCQQSNPNIAFVNG